MVAGTARWNERNGLRSEPERDVSAKEAGNVRRTLQALAHLNFRALASIGPIDRTEPRKRKAQPLTIYLIDASGNEKRLRGRTD